MAAEGMIIDFNSSDSTDFQSATPSPIKANYSDHFWGTDCRGFEVLITNLKAQVSASHQLGEYVKERVAIEKTYVKSLRKLSKVLNSVADSGLGGFYPVWLVFLRTLDQVCIGKDRQVNSLMELSKEILEYSTKQDDQMKNNMKGDIDTAQKSLSTYRSMLSTVRKSHKSYEQSCSDLAQQETDMEKIRADPQRDHDLKKMEQRVKKMRASMEHLKSEHQKDISTCNERLKEFEEKMSKACVKFQSLEEAHLTSMRNFMMKLASAHQTCDISIYKEYKQLTEKMESFQVEKLISMFSQLKGTGRSKPEPIRFTPIEVSTISLGRRGSLGGDDDVPMATGEEVAKHKTAKKRLFKEKKKKRKKEAGAKGDSSTTSVKSTTEQQVQPTDNKEDDYEVDEEGFRIRPKDADKIAKFSDDSSHDDSSDFESDSDNEPEKHLKNIKIKMKEPSPASSASTDELSQFAKNLKLDPLPLVPGGVPRSGSSQSLNTSQLHKVNISADSRSLHDPLDDSNNISLQKPPSSLGVTSGPNYDISLPPAVISSSPSLTPSNTSNTSASQLSWNLSSSSDTPTAQSVQNWATFSSDFSGGSFSTPEAKARTPTPQNKSIDLGKIGTSTGNQIKEETAELSKTLPVAPVLAPPPGKPNPTGSLLLPPPGKTGGNRRRVETSPITASLNNTRTSSSPSVGEHPVTQRRSSISSLDKTVSPLMSAQRSRNSSTSSPSIVKSNNMGNTAANIPFAVAFQEHCHAVYKGTDYTKALIKVQGQMDFSFPATCLSQLESQEPLKFRLVNVSSITKILHNENILQKEDEHTYVFIMSKLAAQLKELDQKKKSPFCNVQGLKYEVSCSESNFPFRVTSAWVCDQSTTSIKIDYIYNPSVFPSASKPTLTNGNVMVTVGGGVTQHMLEPLGLWIKDKNLAGWRLGPLLPNTEPISGTLSGKFTLGSGPSAPSSAIIQFLCDGSTLSGISMILLSSNSYKVSLMKNKCLAGKFIAEPQD